MNTNNPFSLEGRTVLVTGASSGIGKATAIACAQMGARVILTGRNEQRLQAATESLAGEGHQWIACDLSDPDAIKQLVEQLPELQGLVNNAGFTRLAPLQYIKPKDFEEIMQVNTYAPIFLLQQLVKKKKLKAGASVVFTSSLAGIGLSTVGNGMYTASKGAISAYVCNAALELASKKIRVNAVCPAMVTTEILAEGTVSDEQLQNDAKQYPLGRYGKPEEVAYCIIFLLSEAASYITGINLPIDGGVRLK